MTQKLHHRAISNTHAALKKYTFIFPTFMLLAGFLLGAYFIRHEDNEAKKNTPTKTIAFLLHDGATTRTWNGITVYEGESVVSILDRIARTENIGLSWSGSGRDRQITSLAGKDVGARTWKTYINNAPMPTTIGKFYPRPGDTVTMIYGEK